MAKKKIDFDTFYQNIYQKRWPALKEALLKESSHEKLEGGLLKPYFLDYASILAAKNLEVKPGMQVLDMCAAPGGKSLILAQAMQGNGSLVLNDRSRKRRTRLEKVISEHLPDTLKSIIRFSHYDATRWGIYEKNCYERILLDAPCSSERHVLNSPKHLEEWGPSRSKRLAAQAFAMLCAALDALKTGGILLYSTCSLSPAENEELIARLDKKRAGRIKILSASFGPGEEKGPFGTYFLPDKTKGRGPLFMAKLEKIG